MNASRGGVASPGPPSMLEPPRPDLVPAGIDVRGLALAIDALVWLILAMPLAIRSGGVQRVPGSLRVGIYGWPFVMSLLLWLAYMSVCESFAGASLGKRVAGLRVLGPGGGVPGLGRSLTRNLLRFVDALPYVPPYLVGGIVAVRSRTRLRVGDRVAGTRVVRGRVPVGADAIREEREPSTSALLAGLILVVLVTAVGSLTLKPPCSVGDGRFDCYGVSLRYPSGWARIEEVDISRTPTQEWVEAIGVDGRSLVSVQAYRRLRSTLSVSDLEYRESLLAKDWAETLHGSFEGPQTLEVSGHPAFRIEVRGTLEGSPFTIVSVSVYDRTTEYAVVCQWKDAFAERIQPGCEQVLSTLDVP